MAEEAPEKKEEAPAAPEGPTPKKSDARPRKRAAPAEEAKAAPSEGKKAKKGAEGPKVRRRPDLDPETARLLQVRGSLENARPLFVRQAAHRYARVGRWENWRRPRGLQSKQRRHYGYRSEVVSVGYGSPAATRGLTPTGFRPVLVHSPPELQGIDPAREAAVIARTVGTRRRLVLEETARKLGIKVLNPIVKEERET